MMNQSRMNLRMMPNIGFGILVLVLIATAWANYRNANQFTENSKSVTHTYEVLKQIGVVLSDLQDAETGQRGYIITGDDQYLEPYKAASSHVNADIDKLKALTQDNPHQQSRIEQIRPLVMSKLGELAETIQLRREKGFSAALDVVAKNTGKQIMDDIRRLMAQMEDEERSLLSVRDKETADSIAATVMFIIGGSGVAIAILVLVVIAFNRMARKVEELFSAIGETTGNLTSASTELLAGTTQQSASAQEQAAAVAETVTTVDEVRQTAEQAAQRATAMSESAQRAAEIGKSGRQAVDESVASMATVKEQTEAIAESIVALAERAQAIGEIIASVNDVADQTNLLALNAGIEAARAGEYGAGFTVVAREIKDLADQAKKATAKVRQILGEIQKATNSAVLVTEEGSKSVNTTIKAVNRAGETIRALAATVDDAALAANQITASAGQQATGMSQIQQAMRDISQATTQSLASTKQAESAAKSLNALGAKLTELLAK